MQINEVIGNKYFNRPFNPSILGNYPFGVKEEFRTGFPGATVLPNCVGFVVGLFNLMNGVPKCSLLVAKGDAWEFVDIAKRQGLKVGMEPMDGAVACWSKDGSAGHVAYVQKVIDNDTILLWQSGWNSSKPCWESVHKRGEDGQWTSGEAWMMGKYKLRGFIYPPKKDGTDNMDDYEKFKEYMNRYLKELSEMPASSWATESLEKAKADGIMIGDHGNQRPKSFCTREELAVVIDKFRDRL